ncbi:MAG TPA: hypothetical protein VD767_02575 [Thermomicrobiales bacterium]|nr:hypothetical protein [Thermomicrobiales bacterium]
MQLRIEGPDQIEFVVREDGMVKIPASTFTLEEVFGSAPPVPGGSPDPVREIHEAVKAAYLERHKSHQHG